MSGGPISALAPTLAGAEIEIADAATATTAAAATTATTFQVNSFLIIFLLSNARIGHTYARLAGADRVWPLRKRGYVDTRTIEGRQLGSGSSLPLTRTRHWRELGRQVPLVPQWPAGRFQGASMGPRLTSLEPDDDFTTRERERARTRVRPTAPRLGCDLGPALAPAARASTADETGRGLARSLARPFSSRVPN